MGNGGGWKGVWAVDRLTWESEFIDVLMLDSKDNNPHISS